MDTILKLFGGLGVLAAVALVALAAVSLPEIGLVAAASLGGSAFGLLLFSAAAVVFVDVLDELRALRQASEERARLEHKRAG